MSLTVAPWLTMLAALALAPAAPAGECYYLIVFGSQRPVVNRPDYTHSFGLFIKATREPGACVLETVSISWMPKSLKVQTLRLHPEPGTNLPLFTTLKWCLDNDMRISMWGPFQIRKDLYDRAVAQAAHLESGAVRYKAVDTGYRTDRVSNCIHALSDLAEDEPRLRVGTPAWGDAASYYITLQLRAWIIHPLQTHDWIIKAVGLSCYPLERRDLERNPTTGLLLRAGQVVRHLHLERSSRD